VRAALRNQSAEMLPTGVQWCTVGEINESTDWKAALGQVSSVVHLAARVHQMRESSSDALRQYRRVNAAGTITLAAAAAAAGVRRLVFASSVKVNGEQTALGHSFSESDAPRPTDPYAISKWEAEQELWQIAKDTGLEVVVLRAPLVYGPEVRANFLRLLQLVRLGVPLPFGSVKNARSVLFLGNFADAISWCLKAPKAAGETFLLSDGEDISTPELLRAIAVSMGRPARLLPVPTGLLRFLSGLLEMCAELSRLTDSLTLDSSKIQEVLGWHPPYTLHEGLRLTTRWYAQQATL